MVPPRNSNMVTAFVKHRSYPITRRQQRGGSICLLGPKWSAVDLVRFYEAYRKSGKNWLKVAAAIGRERTVKMVESLFKLNEAYLSLPDGAATLGGFISIMKDRYKNFLGDGPSEEQEVPVNFDAEDGNIVQTTGSELKKGSTGVDSSQLCDTYSRRPKRIKIKIGGKVHGTLEVQADDMYRETDAKVSCEPTELLDEDPEIRRKRLFGDDERISTACEALLMLSTGEPLNTDETGQSSEQLKEGNSAMDIDDKSNVPEAAERPSLGGKVNAFSTAEDLSHPTKEPAQNCIEPGADSAQMIASNILSFTERDPNDAISKKELKRMVAAIAANLEGTEGKILICRD